MSKIEEYLSKIQSAIYGKDVRQSIHDAIAQCYSDVSNPTLSSDAMKTTVNTRIQELLDNGTLSNMTIADGSIETVKIADKAITEDKLTSEIVESLHSAGYVLGADGKKYAVSVDANGNPIATRFCEIPKNGLLCDIHIENGTVVDSTGNINLSNFKINDDGTFSGDGKRYSTYGTDILSGKTITNRTVLLLVDNLFANPSEPCIITDVDRGYGIRVNGSNGVNGVFFDFVGLIFGFPSGIPNTSWLANYANTDKTQYFNDSFLQVVTADFDNNLAKVYYLNSDTVYSTTKMTSTTSTSLWKVTDQAHLKRLIVYDRVLTDDEVYGLSKTVHNFDGLIATSHDFVQGMTGLGTPSAYAKHLGESVPFEFCTDTNTTEGPQTVSYHGKERTFINVNKGTPTLESDEVTSTFEAIYFINPIESLNVGDMYKVEAMVYPYNILTDSYDVEYTSSNESVVECYHGALVAKSVGNATITATITGTSISATMTVAITEKEAVTENFYRVPVSYGSGLAFLESDDGKYVWMAMMDAITKAHEAGFNGVVFPCNVYHVKPTKSGANCIIPSDFTIDFNGATILMDDNEFCHTSKNRPDSSLNPYCLFQFGNFKGTDEYYGYCHNSHLKNLHFYGERRQMKELGYPESNYGEQVLFCKFSLGSVGCSVENIDFHDTVGFNLATTTNGFDQWSGTSKDGAIRGCIRYSDFKLGKTDADGTNVTTTDGADWYTTDFLKLGFTYADRPTLYTDMKFYKVGKMDTATTYGLATRWYEIFWFDADKKLLDYRTHQMCLEKYLLPENAVYFKVNARFDSAPTASIEGKVDVPHVIRVFPAIDPERCEIKNCSFENPHASALSMTGGCNFTLSNIYSENGHSPLGIWSIDYEDGWQAMRHNINYKIMCKGLMVNAGGHDTTTIKSIIDTYRSGSESESHNLIDCAVSNLQLMPKTNDVLDCVTTKNDIGTYGKSTLTLQNKARLRKINFIKDSSIILF